MKFEMSFNCDNASFDVNPNFTIAVCVQRVVHDLNDGKIAGVVRDDNGNYIGRWGLVNDVLIEANKAKAYETKEGLLAALDDMCPFRTDKPRRID